MPRIAESGSQHTGGRPDTASTSGSAGGTSNLVEVSRISPTGEQEGPNLADQGRMIDGLNAAAQVDGSRVDMVLSVSQGRQRLLMDRGIVPPAAQVTPVPPEGDPRADPKFWVPVAIRSSGYQEKDMGSEVETSEKPPLSRFAETYQGSAVVDIRSTVVAGDRLDQAERRLAVRETMLGSHAETDATANAEQHIITLARAQLVVARGDQSGVLSASVAVGAQDRDSAIEAAREFAARTSTRRVVVVPGGEAYSRDLAHAAASEMFDGLPPELKPPSSHTTLNDFAEWTALPVKRGQEPIGIPRVERPFASPNPPEVAAGKATATIGQVVARTSEGERPTGDMSFAYRETHVVGIGSSGLGKTGFGINVLAEVVKGDELYNAALPAGAPRTVTVPSFYDFGKELDHQKVADRLAAPDVPHSGIVVGFHPGALEPGQKFVGIGMLENTPGYPPEQFGRDVYTTLCAGFSATETGPGGGDKDIENRIFSTALYTALFGAPGFEGLLTPEVIFEAKRTGILRISSDALAARATASVAMHKAAGDPDFQLGEHTRSVINFVGNSLRSTKAGTVGRSLTQGDPFDWVQAMKDGVGISTSFENVPDHLRGLVGAVMMMKQAQARHVLNTQRQPGDTYYREVRVLDEMRIKDTTIGNAFVEMVERSRAEGTDSNHGGANFVILAQSPDLPSRIMQNAQVRVAFGAGDGTFRKQIGETCGLTEGQTADLGNLQAGEVYFKAPGQGNGVNYGWLTNIDTLGYPKGEGTVRGPEAYVRLSPLRTEPVSEEVRTRAEKFAHDTPTLRMWVHDATVIQAVGEGTVRPDQKSEDPRTHETFDSPLQIRLAELGQRYGQAVVNEMINVALEEEFRDLGREYAKGMDPDALMAYMGQKLKAIAQGGGPEWQNDLTPGSEVRTDLMFPGFRMTPLLRRLDSQMAAPALEPEKAPEAFRLFVEDAATTREQIGKCNDLTMNAYWRTYGDVRERLTNMGQKGNPLSAEETRALCGQEIPGRTAGQQLRTLDELMNAALQDPTRLGAEISVLAYDGRTEYERILPTAELRDLRNSLIARQAAYEKTAPPLQEEEVRHLSGRDVPRNTAYEQKADAETMQRNDAATARVEPPDFAKLVWAPTPTGTTIPEMVVAQSDRSTVFPHNDRSPSLPAAIKEGRGQAWLDEYSETRRTVLNMSPDAAAFLTRQLSLEFKRQVRRASTE